MNITPAYIEAKRLEAEKLQHVNQIEKAKRLKNYSSAYTIAACTAAGIAELLFLYPFEFIKTYSQFSTHISEYQKYHPPMKSAINYIKERGVSGFYVGVQPLYIAALARSCSRMLTYDVTMRQQDAESKRKMFRLYGSIALFLECLVALPFDNIKVHMAHRAYSRVLEPGHHTFVRLLEALGFRAFFRGFWPAVWSISLTYVIRMSTFSAFLPIFDDWAASRAEAVYRTMREQSKLPEYQAFFQRADGSRIEIPRFEYNRPWVGTALIGTAASMASVFLTQPFDMLKTKLQSPERLLYRGSLHCLTQTVKGSGFRSLWRGCTPRMVRATLATPITITIYDHLLAKMQSAGPQPCSDMGRIEI